MPDHSHAVTGLPTLFSPIRIRNTEVRCRAVITAHGASESFRTPGAAPDRYVEYLRRRAAGGVGLIITQPPWFNPGIVQTAENLDRHALLVERVKAEGAVILMQLAHLGLFGRTENDLHRPPLWGFEPVQSVAGETAHHMSDDEVLQMVDAYRQTAAFAAQADFDGVEVHGGHGYLIQQSLTPSFNTRQDRWGEDRTLFAREVLAAVRSEVEDGRIISYRTTTDDLRSPEDGGMGFELGAQYVRRLLDTSVIDVLNTTIGYGNESYARAIPDYRFGEAPNIPAVVRLRQALDTHVPVIGVGKVSSVGIAESLLASGQCDLVAMTRAHIADPDILLKARTGQAARIRPCVGANVCVNRKLAGFAEISCFHNPQVLRELELVTASTSSVKRLLIVGAGPAGLKAAEVAMGLGHDVAVMDASPRPGGRLRYAGLTAAAALVSSVEHLVGELAEGGVKVEHGVVVDDELLRKYRPDEVILATGASADPSSAFPGAQEAGAIGSVEALEGRVGSRVLVYDMVGANEGALVAEALAARGSEVRFVTPFETVMVNGGELHRVQLPETFHRRMHQVITMGIVGLVDDGVATVVRANGDTVDEFPVDTIVTMNPLVSNVELQPVLERLGVPYRVIGDALAPRNAMQAYKEGHEAALAVGVS